MNRVSKAIPFALLALLASACSGEQQETRSSEAQPAAVRAVPAATVQATTQTRAVGVLAPLDEIRLAFKVGGVVDSITVDSGDVVRKGQTIGYVGTTGNAPVATPHLHFAIFKLGADKRWWEGEPLDPFLALRGNS